LRSEKWSRRKTEHSRNQVCRKTAHCHVVVLHSGVEVPALDRNSVLCAFQLRLQTKKILISDFSKFAAPETVFTRFGIKSARR
jgi:hypothetical protein